MPTRQQIARDHRDYEELMYQKALREGMGQTEAREFARQHLDAQVKQREGQLREKEEQRLRDREELRKRLQEKR